MRYLISAALLFSLAACGGGQENRATPEPAATVDTSSEASASVEVGMEDACSEIEAALPTNLNDGANADPVADPRGMASLLSVLEKIESEGDLETRNATASLAEAAMAISDGFYEGDESSLTQLQEPFYASIDALAVRCAAAGSSALQGASR